MRTQNKDVASTARVAKLTLLGESPAFLGMLANIERYAACDATVLIDGETGTGKELAARAIHYLSERGDGPFIPINCGSIPDALFGSEFFGCVRGAFTDAREARRGLIAQAEGGTLFLDELETLSTAGQVALLRFLQDREYRPLGAAQPSVADVRVIAATNADLTTLVAERQFRQDLLYRLKLLTLDVPPLRARGDDAVLLAGAFLRKLSHDYQRPEPRLHPGAVAALRAHEWPGNVRELENLLHREFLLADDQEMYLPTLRGDLRDSHAERRVKARRSADLAQRPGPVAQLPSAGIAFREAKARVVADFEREYVRALLELAGGNVSKAARLAGKERSRFNRMMRKYQLSARAFRRRESEHPTV
ncbi:MAG TPA: sigma 54-interacting transcriptional regulator [Steroidobacteraceae bacterium]|nr:sigma 54-interacting transcriptional regulator [Steroidobacteraceae bacterium]